MGARDVEAPPVGIVHVLLRDLVRLGVHIDGVLGLGPHEVTPDDAALLRHLTYQYYSITAANEPPRSFKFCNKDLLRQLF